MAFCMDDKKNQILKYILNKETPEEAFEPDTEEQALLELIARKVKSGYYGANVSDELIEQFITEYLTEHPIEAVEIANNLTTSTTGKALDATQGKALKDLLDVLSEIIDNLPAGGGTGGVTADIPIATTTTAGKVKPDGNTISVTSDGTISVIMQEIEYKETVDFSNIAHDKPAVRQNGKEWTVSGWNTYDYISVKGVLKISATNVPYYSNGGNIIAPITFYDSNKIFISSYPSTIEDVKTYDYSLFSEDNIIVPENAAYVKITYDAAFDNITTIVAFIKTKKTVAGTDLPVGGSSEGTSTSESLPLKILCIGDSLTRGDYGSDPEGSANVQSKNYPHYLGKYLRCPVMNAGACGLTASEWYKKEASRVDFNGVTTIVIMLGTNGGLTDTLEADTTITENQTYNDYADTTTGNYCKIIEHCLERTGGKAQIFLVTPPHVGIKRIAHRNAVIAAAPIIKKIAQKYNLKVIDVLNESGFSDYTQDVYQPIDNLHFGELGYKKLATFIGSNIKSNLSYDI